jgi:hypothetical protein
LTATLPSVFNEIHTPSYLFLFQSPQRAIYAGPFFDRIHSFFRTLYRRPALQHSVSPLRSFRDPGRSVPESSCAWGMRRSEPTLKPRNEQRSNEFLRGIFTSLGAVPWREIIEHESPVAFGNCDQQFFRRCSSPLGRYEFHEHRVVSEIPVPLRTSTTKSDS